MIENEIKQSILNRVNAIKWVHQIDVGHGIITRGEWPTRKTVEAMKLPDLIGKTVLDIGAWDGFYSFEAESRGASRVLATDWYIWSGLGKDERSGRAGFDLAHELRGSYVEVQEIDVLDISPDTVGMWDVVLFLGVLYHMRHPLLALEKVYSVTRDMAVIESHFEINVGDGRPWMVFYPGRELNNDASNWWGPNESAIHAMLRTVGFARIETIDSCSGGSQGRIIVHAWR